MKTTTISKRKVLYFDFQYRLKEFFSHPVHLPWDYPSAAWVLFLIGADVLKHTYHKYKWNVHWWLSQLVWYWKDDKVGILSSFSICNSCLINSHTHTLQGDLLFEIDTLLFNYLCSCTLVKYDKKRTQNGKRKDDFLKRLS